MAITISALTILWLIITRSMSYHLADAYVQNKQKENRLKLDTHQYKR